MKQPSRENLSSSSTVVEHVAVEQPLPLVRPKKVCGCFSSRHSCCWSLALFFFLFIATIALVLFFYWPRIPSVEVAGPRVTGSPVSLYSFNTRLLLDLQHRHHQLNHSSFHWTCWLILLLILKTGLVGLFIFNLLRLGIKINCYRWNLHSRGRRAAWGS
jgi:hypothetical protein